jgi:hypothetical protein
MMPVVAAGAAGASLFLCTAASMYMRGVKNAEALAKADIYAPKPPPSPWPSLRRRFKSLLAEIYAETVTECVVVAHKFLPPITEGVPTLQARLANVALAIIAVVVAGVGRVERLLGYGGGLPVNSIREASLDELKAGLGRLYEKHLLPSAYEVWIGPRPEGHLALRYAYHANRLAAMLQATPAAKHARCVPFQLDAETIEWVTARVKTPSPPSRLHVWRALKRRLYHYDAGVVAFRGFPRNYLLSTAQWAELLDRPLGHGRGHALDIGAGDGSLNIPMRPLFSRVVATELTTPLVLRLRSVGLDGVLAESPAPSNVLAHFPAPQPAAFDAVLILNVLDRCKDPFAMLDQARSLLSPTGTLVVSVVLPASQSDAALGVGSSQRRWNVDGDTFETACASLVQHVLVPSGFTPTRIVRAPYFCAGDRNSPVAALDACVIALKKIDAGAAESSSAANMEEHCGECRPLLSDEE